VNLRMHVIPRLTEGSSLPCLRPAMRIRKEISPIVAGTLRGHAPTLGMS
jgi:hypothetical protein